jgi:hypothetical protein
VFLVVAEDDCSWVILIIHRNLHLSYFK